MRAIRLTRIEGLTLPSGFKSKKRAPYSTEEETFHKAVVARLRYCLPKLWIVQHARNGGMSKAENGKAKAKGAVAGWPDIQIIGTKDIGTLLPHLVPMSWFIELKVQNKRPSKEQREVHRALRAIGYRVEIAWTWADVTRIVQEWRLPIDWQTWDARRLN